MEREKALWAARAGDYADADRPDALLALRIEDLTSREATQWVALQSQTEGRPVPADEAGPSGGSSSTTGDAADAAADAAAVAPAASPGGLS
jgi:hypothetical protein